MDQIANEVWLLGNNTTPKDLVNIDGQPCLAVDRIALCAKNLVAAITAKYEILDEYYNNLKPMTLILRKTSHIKWTFPNMKFWSILIRGSIEATAIQAASDLGVKTLHLVGVTRTEDIVRTIKESKVQVVWEH